MLWANMIIRAHLYINYHRFTRVIHESFQPVRVVDFGKRYYLICHLGFKAAW